MMDRLQIKYYWMVVMVVCLLHACTNNPENNPEMTKKNGSIYGVITDKATGEPVKAAGVQLNPLGIKTVTGSEGQYEFTALEVGEYTLQVSKTGYADFANYKITVIEGKSNKGDVQIEKLPPSLRVVNNKTEDIDTLDFGGAEDDLTRSFNIFNDGVESLEWEITKTSKWIAKVSKESGTLKAGATQAIIITIDRKLLATGSNTTMIQVTSDNGSKQLTVKATNGNLSASVNVLEVTDITTSSATLNGKITDIGVPSYSERGFVYAASSMPTLESSIAKLTAPVTADVDYAAVASGLTLGQKYYVRAYVINTVDTTYSSNEVSFTAATTLPTLTIEAATNIDQTTVTFNGTIVNTGDPTYTERGFAYGTSNNPTVDDTKKIVSGVGAGIFSSNITGLTEGKVYYVRAYAINEGGIAYSDEISFTTAAIEAPTLTIEAVTNIDLTTATFNGTIVSAGNPAYTERGFVYATSNNPTVDDTKKIATGVGTGVFSSNITGLTEGKSYYVRAYAINEGGIAYSDEISFTTAAIEAPTLTIEAVTNIDLTTVTFNGTIVNAGNPAYTERGFVYATSNNPTVDDTKKIATGVGTGVFSSNITGLTEGKSYYVRAYAINKGGVAYSDEISFTTATIPTLTIEAVTDIDLTTVTFNGTIVSAGDPTYTERGFAYGTSNNPTVDGTKKIVSGVGTGIFSSNITGLTKGKSYYVRAYAINKGGTAYSDEISFTTLAIKTPTLTTQAVTNINTTIATFNGTIVNAGDPTYTERGFVYATSNNPTVDDTKKIVSGVGTGIFSSDITGLTEGKVYYVRAYAINEGGIVYGEQVSFTPQSPYYVKTEGLMVQKKDIGQGEWSDVNTMCENSIVGGFTDWRLPTKEELMLMYNERNEIGGFFSSSSYNKSFYWSSSISFNFSHYYSIYFFDGKISSSSDYSSYSARCVRTLP